MPFGAPRRQSVRGKRGDTASYLFAYRIVEIVRTFLVLSEQRREPRLHTVSLLVENYQSVSGDKKQ